MYVRAHRVKTESIVTTNTLPANNVMVQFKLQYVCMQLVFRYGDYTWQMFAFLLGNRLLFS